MFWTWRERAVLARLFTICNEEGQFNTAKAGESLVGTGILRGKLCLYLHSLVRSGLLIHKEKGYARKPGIFQLTDSAIEVTLSQLHLNEIRDFSLISQERKWTLDAQEIIGKMLNDGRRFWQVQAIHAIGGLQMGLKSPQNFTRHGYLERVKLEDTAELLGVYQIPKQIEVEYYMLSGAAKAISTSL